LPGAASKLAGYMKVDNNRATRFRRVEGGPLQGPDKRARFAQAVLPHLDAAYNLARWLTRNDHDAEDVVQEAFLRAYKFFDGSDERDRRAWLLTIVRNTCYTWLKQNRPREAGVPFDEHVHGAAGEWSDPQRLLEQRAAGERVRAALEELPVEYREVLVLRELEGMSYKEVAKVAGLPLGTVMSRLSRARQRLQQALGGPTEQGVAR
jgi:RNA polymerase sigma-70 factor (ECF subfamily)